MKIRKLQRLLLRREFNAVYKRGKKHVGKRLIFFYLLEKEGPPKLGITIAKKWGKAHDRNRFKRVVREGFRVSSPLFPRGLCLNVHPRTGYQELSPEEVIQELKQLKPLDKHLGVKDCCGQTQPQPTESGRHH